MSGDEFSWRPIEPGDAGEWARLLAAIQAADQTWDVFTEADLLEHFADPSLDFPHGSVAVFDGATMVGYDLLMPRGAADPVHDMRSMAGVHPDYRRRGIGGALLEWAEQAAPRLHRERFPGRPLSLSVSCRDDDAAAGALFARRGYQPVRWFHAMIRDLSAEVVPVPAAAGVENLPLTPERSEQALMIRNEAFRDHWGSTETSAESWAHFLSSRTFRSAFSFVAYDHGEPAGVIISHEYEAAAAATGTRDLYIAIVGTRRAARKRGLASSLLTRVLTDGKAAGFGTASLGVDADSTTGAVGVYERAGFTVDHTAVTQCKKLATE
jgi:mycothiol synthase